MKLDRINLEIIKQLREGRKSLKQIADSLSITENTVRSRVNKLKAEGILDITGLIDPNLLSGHTTAFIGVNLKTMDKEKAAEKISELKGVISVSLVTGRYDLMVSVMFKEGFGLLEFNTKEMSQIEDILSVETFIIYKGYNLKVPYIL